MRRRRLLLNARVPEVSRYDDEVPPRRVTGITRRGRGERVHLFASADRETGGHWFWYADGRLLAGPLPRANLLLRAGNPGVDLTVRYARYRDYEAKRCPPAAWPARRLIEWIAATGAAEYRCDYADGQGAPAAEDWDEFATVRDDGGWRYGALSPELTGQTYYWWRITPLDAGGNEGTPLTLGPEFYVRRPAAPAVSVAYSGDTGRITVT